jgi:predicted membrane protein
MDKDSAAWLALRIIGLLALGRAFLSMLSALVDALNLWKLYGVTFEALASQTERLILQTWIGVGFALTQSIFFALVAFYFLRRGRAIHKLLMHEPV